MPVIFLAVMHLTVIPRGENMFPECWRNSQIKWKKGLYIFTRDEGRRPVAAEDPPFRFESHKTKYNGLLSSFPYDIQYNSKACGIAILMECLNPGGICYCTPHVWRIYNSLDYVENKVTIFHSSFLKSSTNSKTKNLVSLGHFILPPASLHEEIRREIGNFIWEQDNTPEVEQGKKTPCRDTENDNRSIECITRKEVWKTGSDLSDDVMCHTLLNYPVNNMFTGYISIDQMKKFSGELHDFTPDASEYFVFCVQGESNNFSGIKNVLNKKNA